jgi:hypothetical protein
MILVQKVHVDSQMHEKAYRLHMQDFFPPLRFPVPLLCSYLHVGPHMPDNVYRLRVQEFHPYVFQIFAQLIELRAPPLPPLYMAIFKPLLAPLFWERPGNVPALTRLLRAYLAKAGGAILEQGLLEVGCLHAIAIISATLELWSCIAVGSPQPEALYSIHGGRMASATRSLLKGGAPRGGASANGASSREAPPEWCEECV